MIQAFSLVDVKKAAQMFHHMGVPIAGVIENMSYFQDPSSKEIEKNIFWKGKSIFQT